MAISSIGVGSGLPIDELLADLRKSENHTLRLIQDRQDKAEDRLSAYGKLKSALSSLETAAKTLNDADTYGAFKTRTSAEAFTAKASPGAMAGQYAIRVDQLATHQSLVAQGVADRSQAIGTGGQITLNLQNGQSTTIDLSQAEGTSLTDIAQAINNHADAGVHASIINDGDTDTPYRLLLTSRETGTEASVQAITVQGNADLAELLAFEVDTDGNVSGTLTHEAAHNAQLNINGIAITSGSNTVEHAIEGVTLNLEDTTSGGTPEALSVVEDTNVTTKAVKDFVKAYNTLQDTIQSLTAYDIENHRASALTGDSLARRLQGDIRSTLNVFGSRDGLRTLGQLGITTDTRTGKLEVDDSKLADAVKNHATSVKNLLSGTTGLAGRVTQVAETFTRSGGLFSTSTDSINRSITDIQRQYEIASERIDNKMEGYRRQFSQLDSMLAEMNSVSNYLTQQLAMLNNLATGNKGN